MENVVCIGFLRYGWSICRKSVIRKIDFIVSKDDHKVYIQVAYVFPMMQLLGEIWQSFEIADNYPKYVVTMDEIQSGEITKELNRFHRETFVGRG